MDREADRLEGALLEEHKIPHHGLSSIDFSLKAATVNPFRTGGIIEDQLEDPSAFRLVLSISGHAITLPMVFTLPRIQRHMAGNLFRVVHKQEGAGCLHPAEFWPLGFFMCPVLKLRTVDWITENAIVRNTPIFCLFYPTTCIFCTTYDIPRLCLLDQSPFHPYCEGLGSPLGAVGYANEEDLCDFGCCSCIDNYRRFLQPCFGELLVTVPCENGSQGFDITTKWCLFCLMFPLSVCIADSKTYREVLIRQVAKAQGKAVTDRQRTVFSKTTPEAEVMDR